MEILKKFTDFALNSDWCVDGESTQNGFLFYNAQTNDRWVGWQAAQTPVAPESFEQTYSEIFSPIVKRPYPRLENGDYKYIEIDQGWKLWQAATAQVVPEGFVLVRNKPVAYMVQNKSWTYQEGNNYFEAKLLKEMPEPAFDGDSYDIEIPLYMIEAQEQSYE